MAYNSQFEKGRINVLADFSATNKEQLLSLNDRMVDPLPIIRDSVYDNAFSGSFSLKKVAPALLGELYSYDNMLVANGQDAQRAFAELIASNTPINRKTILKSAMIEYCKKDTIVMVELVKWFYDL